MVKTTTNNLHYVYIYLAKTFLRQWFFRHKVAILNILQLSHLYRGDAFLLEKIITSGINVRIVYAQLMQVLVMVLGTIKKVKSEHEQTAKGIMEISNHSGPCTFSSGEPRLEPSASIKEQANCLFVLFIWVYRPT